MNLKELYEKRAKARESMKALIDKAGTEKRSLNEDEIKEFEKLEAEIRSLDATIAAAQAERELGDVNYEPEKTEKKTEERSAEQVEAEERRSFEDYLRGNLETRNGEGAFTVAKNGAVIPSSIANKIIEKVRDICPIFQDAERFNVGGKLSIPYYDTATSDIAMAYADEFTEATSTSGDFKSIELGGFLARAMTDVSKSLVNNSQFDIVSFVVTHMGENIAFFIEKELLKGTSGKVDGLSKLKNKVTTASATAITADEIIDLQEAVADRYQQNAYFIMSKKTRTAIRKLKDGQGNYLLNQDANARWGYTLFGKDVYVSENMDEMQTGKTAIFYGDYTGLAVKVSENINIDVLREIKAAQHAIEVLAFVEFDAKVQNEQKLAKLVMK